MEIALNGYFAAIRYIMHSEEIFFKSLVDFTKTNKSHNNLIHICTGRNYEFMEKLISFQSAPGLISSKWRQSSESMQSQEQDTVGNLFISKFTRKFKVQTFIDIRPISSTCLPKKSHWWVPKSTITLKAPPPVWTIVQQGPCWNIHGTS